MKKLLFLFVFASIVLNNAEVRTQTQPLPPSPTIKLNAEQTHIIKEIVLKEHDFPKSESADFKIGDAPPADVKLESFPDLVGEKVSAVKSYKFFLSGQNIVVVNPRDNKIAEVID